MKSALADIYQFLPTLKMEIDAFAETRTKHDQKRARKALDHLADMVENLDNKVKGATTSDDSE